MRGRRKRTMLTGKATGQPVENGNDAPGKRESRVEKKEDGQGEKMRTVFSVFFTFGPEEGFPRSRRRKERRPEPRKEVKGEVKRSGTESTAALDRMSRCRQKRMETEAQGEFPWRAGGVFCLSSSGLAYPAFSFNPVR